MSSQKVLWSSQLLTSQVEVKVVFDVSVPVLADTVPKVGAHFWLGDSETESKCVYERIYRPPVTSEYTNETNSLFC